MRQGWTEADVQAANMRRGKGVSPGGVKEHTPDGGREGGSLSDRRASGTAVKSSSRTSQATNLYRSKWEAAYASKLELEKRAGIIKAYWYEPFSLWLPGNVRYKPDFLVQRHADDDDRLEIVEVKGWSRNRRDGVTRLKIAAAIFSCFMWRMVYRTNGGGWDGEYL